MAVEGGGGFGVIKGHDESRERTTTQGESMGSVKPRDRRRGTIVYINLPLP
jgi:hypothetical protein